jgi:acyl carrier protein phosphodiesterase
MNYFAHGRNWLHAPYVLAGTAVPDWLSVVDRRVRARSRLARQWIDRGPEPRAQLARGIVLHHHDDAWFHQTRAFAELSLQLTLEVRQLLPEETGFRPSFLGHILVEILLDAALIERDARQLDAYYQALQSLDPVVVSQAVHQMTTGSTERLPQMIRVFCQERFLYDYQDDAKLLTRLNRVMRRVKLPELPQSMVALLAAARQPVRERMDELLDGPQVPEFKEKGQ